MRSDTAAHLDEIFGTRERHADLVPRGLIDPRVVRLELLRLRSSSASWAEMQRPIRIPPALVAGERG
ncbi:MAG TPA: hypothetical protein VHT27_11740 [Solirubrobacteraceae bacterium]|nr:hypothetical protein [Solirubrobacteraceae bacterium]